MGLRRIVLRRYGVAKIFGSKRMRDGLAAQLCIGILTLGTSSAAGWLAALMMIKRDWVRRYDQLPVGDYVIESWDTASKESGQNSFSACTTWLIHDTKYYLIDVLRGRFDYTPLPSQGLWRRVLRTLRIMSSSPRTT